MQAVEGQMMMSFQKLAAVGLACYEGNDKDEDAQPLHAQVGPLEGRRRVPYRDGL